MKKCGIFIVSIFALVSCMNGKSRGKIASKGENPEATSWSLFSPVVSKNCGGASCHSDGSNHGVYVDNEENFNSDAKEIAEEVFSKNMPKNNTMSKEDFDLFKVYLTNILDKDKDDSPDSDDDSSDNDDSNEQDETKPDTETSGEWKVVNEVLRKNCGQCHSEGSKNTVYVDNKDQVLKDADLIYGEIDNKSMPKDATMSDEDTTIIINFLDSVFESEESDDTPEESDPSDMDDFDENEMIMPY